MSENKGYDSSNDCLAAGAYDLHNAPVIAVQFCCKSVHKFVVDRFCDCVVSFPFDSQSSSVVTGKQQSSVSSRKQCDTIFPHCVMTENIVSEFSEFQVSVR